MRKLAPDTLNRSGF